MDSGLFRGVAARNGAGPHLVHAVIRVVIAIHPNFFGFRGGVMMSRDRAVVASAASTRSEYHGSNQRSWKKKNRKEAATRSERAVCDQSRTGFARAGHKQHDTPKARKHGSCLDL